MVRRTSDWLRQAEKDLKHAKKDLKSKDYEWACFSTHQAAEKAVKALLQAKHIDAWGHTISKLFIGLDQDDQPSQSLLDHAKQLDRHYIPTRYPNAHDSGAPMDFYTKQDAIHAIDLADEIIEFCKSKIPKDQLPKSNE